MKALDVLVAARNRLSNINNWATGSLVRRCREADGGFSFCAVGATLNAGGWYNSNMKLMTDVILDDFHGVHGKERQAMESLQCNMYVGDEDSADMAMKAIDGLKTLISQHGGFHARTTIMALSYLQNAAKKAYGSDVVSLNDRSNRHNAINHERVLAVFDLAIRNAKRRHPNGGARKLKDQALVLAA